MKQKLICVENTPTGDKYLNMFLDAGWTIKNISGGGSSSTSVSHCWVLLEK